MAKRRDTPPPAVPPTDAAGHRYEPLDPDVEPKPPKMGSSSDFLKKYGWPLLSTATVLVFLVTVAAIVKGHGRDRPVQQASSAAPAVAAQAAIPHASQPQSEWWKLGDIPPGGKSKVVPVPPDRRPVMAGYDFHLYNVYEGGQERPSGDTSLEGTPMTGVYALNLRAGVSNNTVLLAFSDK